MPSMFSLVPKMTVREFFETNIPDIEGRVPILIFRDETSGSDASLYLCFNDDERWRLFDAKVSQWIDTQANRDLFPLVSEWLDEHFGSHLHGQGLDLSECYNEIFGQIQTTGCAVDLQYSSLTSVLNNTQWELEQEGLQTNSDSPDHGNPLPFSATDVLLISDTLEYDRLSNVLWSKSITFQKVTSLPEAMEYCKKAGSSVILLDSKTLQPADLSKLPHFADLPSKLITIVSENNPDEELITDLSDDTFFAPVDDKTIIHCIRRHLKPFLFLPPPKKFEQPKHTQLDVLLVYGADASTSIQQTFDAHCISSSKVVSIQNAIAFCDHTIPSFILLDAKNLLKSQIVRLESLRRTIPQETKIFSCLTETSPYQNKIIALSNHIFLVPVRTSEIMKHVLIGL